MTSTRLGVVRFGTMLLAALAVMATPRSAAGQKTKLVGTWEVTAEANMPPTIAMTWTFEAEEDGTVSGTWTGKAEGESRTREASEIWVDGDGFGFTVRIVEDGQTGMFTFEGTLSGNEVTGTFDVGVEGMPQMITGTFSGARAEESDPRRRS
ncbi:hypothetical protein [Candidatus Palauibacter sp.]|uniref:hypothetical protein n=1 Tax=Candidatus Palauibacter sp. TaxID=3101350 RepID=UPI003B02D99B